METREKRRKTNSEDQEIEGSQQVGAGAAHALAQKHDANRQKSHPDNAQINLDERNLEEIQNFHKERSCQLDEIKIELN